jgi:hypothetical protein
VGAVVVGEGADCDQDDRGQERDHGAHREAHGERDQRAAGEVPLAPDQRHRDGGERAELRPHDHRAHDQDRLVEDDPDRGDLHRGDHEDREGQRQLGLLRGARFDLLPDDRV